jgi:hypothetical protein
MNRLGLGILAVLLVLAFGLWGCGGSEPLPPVEEDSMEGEPAEEAPPPPAPEEPAEEAPPPPPPEEETEKPPASGTEALYAEAEALHRAANAAWKTFQADKTRENWEKAKEAVGKAQELCDKIAAQDPDYDPVHELGMKCNSLRRMILDMEPTE